MTGDLITTTASVVQRVKNKMAKALDKKTESVENLVGVVTKVPEPVFFCSIEPPSLASQSALENALTELQREDPSLRVTNDAETGQTVLSGKLIGNSYRSLA